MEKMNQDVEEKRNDEQNHQKQRQNKTCIKKTPNLNFYQDFMENCIHTDDLLHYFILFAHKHICSLTFSYQ